MPATKPSSPAHSFRWNCNDATLLYSDCGQPRKQFWYKCGHAAYRNVPKCGFKTFDKKALSGYKKVKNLCPKNLFPTYFIARAPCRPTYEDHFRCWPIWEQLRCFVPTRSYRSHHRRRLRPRGGRGAHGVRDEGVPQPLGGRKPLILEFIMVSQAFSTLYQRFVDKYLINIT